MRDATRGLVFAALLLAASVGASRGDAPVRVPTYPYTFGGEAALSVLGIDAAGADPRRPETAGYFNIRGIEGGGSDSYAFKAALVGVANISGAGGSGWGANLVCSLNGRLVHDDQVVCAGLEADVNNSAADRAGPLFGSRRWSVGVVVNGGGTHLNNAGVEVTDAAKITLWDFGFRVSQRSDLGAGFTGVRTAAFGDTSNAPQSFMSTGAHRCGLCLRQATFRGTDARAIETPGFDVDPSGRLAGAALALRDPGGLRLPMSTLAELGVGEAGALGLCSDCVKPFEASGAGTGMLVFRDHDGWRSVGTGRPASR